MLIDSPSGPFCPAGGFHVDPWGPAERALITHVHGDHARPGSARISLRRTIGGACSNAGSGPSVPIESRAVRTSDCDRRRTRLLSSRWPRPRVGADSHRRRRRRLGRGGRLQARRGPDLRAVRARAAATPSSPSPRLACRSIAGIAPRPSSTTSWSGGRRTSAPSGRRSLFCYTIGKAQRILAELARVTDRTVFVHGAMLPMIDAYRDAGVAHARDACRSPSNPGRRNVRRRARAGAAVGPRHAVDAPARRSTPTPSRRV